MRFRIKLWALVLLLPLAILLSNLATADEQAGSQSGLPTVTLAKTYKLAPSRFTGSFMGLSDQIAPTAVAWSPDGKTIAAITNYGNRIEVWSKNGGKPRVIEVSTGNLQNTFEFLDNDNILAPANAPMTPSDPLWGLSIWNAKDGSFVKGIPSQYPEKDFRYNFYTLSPDRSLAVALAIGGSGSGGLGPSGFAKLGTTQEFAGNPVPVYSTKTWEIIQRLPIAWPSSVAFSPDGKQIAFGAAEGTIVFYDTTTWQLVKTIAPFEQKQSPSIDTLAYSPDGQYLAAGATFFNESRNVKPVRVVRVSDGEIVAAYADDMLDGNLHDTITIRNVSWNQQHNFIAFFSANEHKLHFWNPAQPNDLGRSIHFNFDSTCQRFSPDGQQLATCSSDGISVFNLNF